MALATGTFAFAVTVAWWAATLGGLSYWFWERFVPRGSDDTTLAELIGLGSSRSADVVLQSAIGVLALLTLTFAMRVAVSTA